VYAQGLGYTTAVTPGLIARYAERFGPGVRDRLAGWAAFARGERLAPAEPLARLQRVNSHLNKVRFIDDAVHWGLDDYWATPAETVASHGGDCEDYAIAKYFLLKELGTPVQQLRITYVKAATLNQAHMVVAYYPSPGADPLLLDNLEDRVQPASQRPDLIPVYSFNDDDVTLVASGRRASPLQIRAWKGLLERLQAEARL
jgi:predicted transglutaminase-like cysteine proteinase